MYILYLFHIYIIVEYHSIILSNNIINYIFKWIDIPNIKIQVESLSILKYLVSNSILLLYYYCIRN